MILSGLEIRRLVLERRKLLRLLEEAKDRSEAVVEHWSEPWLYIDPFNENQLNPNSYNLTLSKSLLVYQDQAILDPRKENPTLELEIPESGFVLRPGKLYLGSTQEYTETVGFAPFLEGRSSIGRLGIQVHSTAGFGDTGFKGTWTLEISCTHEVIVYPRMQICQIAYSSIQGEYENYSSKYLGQDGPVASRLFMEY